MREKYTSKPDPLPVSSEKNICLCHSILNVNSFTSRDTGKDKDVLPWCDTHHSVTPVSFMAYVKSRSINVFFFFFFKVFFLLWWYCNGRLYELCIFAYLLSFLMYHVHACRSYDLRGPVMQAQVEWVHGGVCASCCCNGHQQEIKQSVKKLEWQ